MAKGTIHRATSKPRVEIVRHVDLRKLAWPSNSQARSGLGGNKEYVDLRGVDWSDADRILTLEEELTDEIDSSNDRQATYERIIEELYDEDEGLLGLDLGVAGVVASLSVVHCIPFTSCNGGFYGGHHPEYYPLVGFYARPKVVPILLIAATEADIGLTNEEGVFAYSDNVENMLSFARSLLRVF
jgi:hypothetical protein